MSGSSGSAAMAEDRERGRRYGIAPFLKEVAGFCEFERRRTAVNVAMQRAHHWRPEHRVGHADRHHAVAAPVIAPEVACGALERGAVAVERFRHQVRKTPHAGLVADI